MLNAMEATQSRAKQAEGTGGPGQACSPNVAQTVLDATHPSTGPGKISRDAAPGSRETSCLRLRLKSRLALVVVLFMAAFVACYSALLWTEVPERVDAETQGSLPWVLSLLPGGVDVRLPSDSARLVQLVALVKELEGIRHVRISLHAPDGQILASTPSRAEQVPDWFAPGLDEPRPASRKDVRDGDRLVAYFEVGPATSDELAELWEDFVRSIWVVGGLSMGAIALIVAFTFRTLQFLDRIRDVF